MKMYWKAFTLIELVVVIVIIILLAGLLMAVFSRARAKARAATCASNLRQLGAAFLIYAQDYDGQFPIYSSETGWLNGCIGYPAITYNKEGPHLLLITMKPYVRNNDIWFCPSDPYAGTNTFFWCISHEYTSYEVYMRQTTTVYGHQDPGFQYVSSSDWGIAFDPNPYSSLTPSPCGDSNYTNFNDCMFLHPMNGGNHFEGCNELYADDHVKLSYPQRSN